jgi:cytochrome c-type biogenesis protein CcmH/NrfG
VTVETRRLDALAWDVRLLDWAARTWAETRPAGLAAATLVPIAAASGGYFPSTWGWTAVALCWVSGLALALRSVIRLAPLEVAALAGLGAFAAWTAASLLWSPAAGPTVLELERTLVYWAVLLAAAVVARSGSYRSLLVGTWAAISLVACYSLLTRLFPDRLVVVHTIANNRLSEPVGYWNALGLLSALGAVLALGLVAHARATGLRAFAAGSLIPLALTLYFTFSRGAWVALVVGLVAALALDSRRLRFAVAVGTAAPFAAFAVAFASLSEPLTALIADAEAAAEDGQRLFAAALLLAAAAGLATIVVAALEPRVWIGKRGRRVAGSALAAGAVLVIAAGLVRLGGPAQAARDAWSSFSAPPAPTTSLTNLNERLLTLSSTWRIDIWRAGLAEYGEHPVLGAGAGTYERAWLERRPESVNARYSHSLYLDALAELGPLGLGLLAAALLPALIAAVRARRRRLVPAAFGAYVAFLAHAGVDWDWEVPAVTVAALLCGAGCLLAARASRTTPAALSPRGRGVALGAVAVVAAFSSVALVSNRAAAASAEAVTDDRLAEARDRAREAARWAPWAAEPWRLLGEAQLMDGRLAEARASFREAIARDPGNWELWLDLSLAGDRMEARRRAALRALALNPLSREIDAIRPALGLEPRKERP